MGWGGTLEEKPKDYVASQPASPAVVCCKSLPQGHCTVASSGPGAWNLPVPTSSSLGGGEVSEQRERAICDGKDTQGWWYAGAGLCWFTRTNRVLLFPTLHSACW